MVMKYHLLPKKPGLFGKMTKSKSMATNAQDEHILSYQLARSYQKLLGLSQKSWKANLKKLSPKLKKIQNRLKHTKSLNPYVHNDTYLKKILVTFGG